MDAIVEPKTRIGSPTKEEAEEAVERLSAGPAMIRNAKVFLKLQTEWYVPTESFSRVTTWTRKTSWQKLSRNPADTTKWC